MKQRWRKLVMLAMDAVLLTVAYAGAYYLRLGGAETVAHLGVIVSTLPVLLGISLLVHLKMGLFHAVLRYASLETAVAVFKGVVLSVLLSCLVLFLLFRLEGIPRTVFVIHAMMAVLLIGGSRTLFRWKWKHIVGGIFANRWSRSHEDATRVLLYGAGDSAEWILRGLRVGDHPSYEAVGLVDRDPAMHGRRILGVKIHGALGILDDIARETEAKELWICVPGLVGDRLRHVYQAATRAGLRVKILRDRAEALGEGGLGRLQDPDITDLLRRPPRHLDRERVRRWIEGRRVLITGAGGSVGSELSRQVARLRPGLLVLCDSCEYNLFSIHRELASDPEVGDRLLPALTSVRDRASVRSLFRDHRPDVVFHAAAYKHVPMVERNPCEGVLTNVSGLRNVGEAAAEAGTRDVVFISTDKAVRPVNVMGATKRLGEILIQLLDRRTPTRFSAVRFGNVLGSSGSVVPIFKEQIRKGGPVTVTHPEMTRFFMLVSEAVELVAQAGSIARGGEVFILDMGQPVNIAEMARDLIRLMGKEPDRDVRIEFSGVRPGEKIDEELMIDADDSRSESQGIWIEGHRTQIPDPEGLLSGIRTLERAARAGDEGRAVRILADLVPEFRPSFEETREHLASPDLPPLVEPERRVVIEAGRPGRPVLPAAPAAPSDN